MNRIYCVLDACSYIYLSKISFIYNQDSINLFEIFTRTDFLTIKHSETIGKEIKRNFSVNTEQALAINRRNYTFSKYKLKDFDIALFSNSLSMSNDDKGEKENIAVGIDLFADKKYSIIYLTDDKKAAGNTGHLSNIIGAFPYFKIWSSFDVILFLYYTHHKRYFDYNRAIDSIRDLNAFLHNLKFEQLKKNKQEGTVVGLKYDKKLKEIQDETQGRIVIYISRIELIRKLISK